MRGNDRIVQQALRALGADESDMERSRQETPDVFLPAGRYENVVALLGRPRRKETLRAADGRPLTRLRYELPLWPGLEFFLVGRPGLPFSHDAGFARRPGVPAIPPKHPDDLRPWAHLRDEVFEAFGPPSQEGDRWPPYEEYKFQVRTPDGRTREFWATFSWHLLQRVEWA
ncbi:hypothetical protein [Spirillospora sp. NPDC047279]|uniref:hypothetical protein n=1 Tax=Spirillospora sp. NPDC047279 TaxID=3155478 RepID=UPI0033D96EED